MEKKKKKDECVGCFLRKKSIYHSRVFCVYCMHKLVHICHCSNFIFNHFVYKITKKSLQPIKNKLIKHLLLNRYPYIF